jgi:hypothetical protein
MSKTTLSAIRLARTPEVAKALARAKKRYPTLSDPEILKLGLAKITTESTDVAEIRSQAAYGVGEDYLNDPDEDLYQLDRSKKQR